MGTESVAGRNAFYQSRLPVFSSERPKGTGETGKVSSSSTAPISQTEPKSLSSETLEISTDPEKAQNRLSKSIDKSLDQNVDPAGKTKRGFFSRLFKSDNAIVFSMAIMAASVGPMALPLLCLGAVMMLAAGNDAPLDDQAPPPKPDDDSDVNNVQSPSPSSGSQVDPLMTKMKEAEEAHQKHAEHMEKVLDWNALDISLDQALGRIKKTGEQERTEASKKALQDIDARLREALSDNEPEVAQAVQWGSYDRFQKIPTEGRAQALSEWPPALLKHALGEAQRLSDGQSTAPAAAKTQASEISTLLKATLVKRGEA